MRRCALKGANGDAHHAVLCAAGYNLRWLLRWIASFVLFFRHLISIQDNRDDRENTVLVLSAA